ncbi:hypothetical protein V2J09_017772 [Rumex salicifolius]
MEIEIGKYGSDQSSSQAIPMDPPGLMLRPMGAVHKVSIQPENSTLQKLKHSLFEDKSPSSTLILVIQSLFPILQWLPRYNLSLFRSDLVAGLTISSLAIPQGISYAKLANLPPIFGLYSSFVPPIVYSIPGSSRHLGVGPVSISSLIMGSMLSEVVSPTKEPERYLKLAFTTTFFAGLFQSSMGIFRLGFIIDFLSKATLVGFTAGAAMIVSLQQLKGLLGISHLTNQTQVIPVISSVFYQRDEIFLVVSIQSLKKPHLFWISAVAPLTSVFVSTLLVFSLKSRAHRITTIGALPEGVNPPSIDMLTFQGPFGLLAMKTGLITAILLLVVSNHILNRLFFKNSNADVRTKESRLEGLVTAIDTSGIDAIYEMAKKLEKRSLQLVIVNLAGSVTEKLHKSKVLEIFVGNELYMSVQEAVFDITSSWKA